MQCAPNGDGECPRNAHRRVLLKPCNGIAYFWREYPIDGSAVITKPTQRRLHGAHISGLLNYFLVTLEVVRPSPLVARRKVRGVESLPLMEKSPFVSLRQRID